jgi:integrase
MAVTGNLQIRNSKYHAVINLYDEDGKRRQKWICTNLPIRGNKKAAEAFLSDQIAKYDCSVVPYTTITVADYFRKWLKKIEKKVRPNTYRNYAANMENHIIPYFEAKKITLQNLTTEDLERYYSSKLKKGSKLRSGEALSPTTVKHHQQNISKALADAVHDKLIKTNPASTVVMPKPEGRVRKFRPEFLSTREIDELMFLFVGSVVELPVRLCAFYGFRRSEVLGLKWNAIDFDR